MLKFIRGKGQQPSAERQKLQNELFAFRKTVQHGFPNRPSALAWDPLLRLAAIGTSTGALKVYGQPGVEFYGQHTNSDAAVWQIHFIPGTGRLVSLCEDNSLHLWEINEKSLVELKTYTKEGKNKRISAACVESSGNHMLIGTDGGNLYTMDLNTFTVTEDVIYQDVVMQNCPEDFKVNPGAVECVCEHPKVPSRLLIGYNRGLVVLWDRDTSAPTHTFVSNQQLESVCWNDEGEHFTSSHNDGSYVTWEVGGGGGGERPLKEPVTPYGPYPCKAITKILNRTSVDGEDVTIYAGGMPRASYAEKYTVTVQQGEKHVAFDFTSRVVDFFTTPPVTSAVDQESRPDSAARLQASTVNQTAATLVVLAEEELVVIDLTDPSWRPIRPACLVSLHASAVTAAFLASNVQEQIYDTIAQAGLHQTENIYSESPWPISGGELSDPAEETPDRQVLLTGHEDGSVRFWDVSGVAMTSLYKYTTAQLFSGLKRTTTSGEEVAEAAEAGEGEAEEEEWPPFRRIGIFDPYSDDPRLAVKKVVLCPISGMLTVGGAAGQIIIASLKSTPTTAEIKSLSVNVVSDRDGFVWKGHDQLTLRGGAHNFPQGYQASLVGQLSPPAAITALGVARAWGAVAAGTAHGLAVLDAGADTPKQAATKCTLRIEHTNAGDTPISRRKSFKKSLRESFRRLRKGRSQRRQTTTGSNPAPAKKAVEKAADVDVDVKPVERAVEARPADDAYGSMVRCLYFANTHLVHSTSCTPTLWAGTNSGAVLAFTLTVPAAARRHEQHITCQLAKEIQLKHRAPVIGITILDAASAPLPNSLEVEHGERSLPEPGPQRVVITSEEQFKVFSLPALKPHNKYKLTAHEGARVRRCAFAQFTCASHSEWCLLCVTNLGDCLVLSADLRRQLNAAAVRKEDINGISSMCFSKRGEALYLHSSSELQRISLSATKVTVSRCTVPLAEWARALRAPPAPPNGEAKEETVEAAAAHDVTAASADITVDSVRDHTNANENELNINLQNSQVNTSSMVVKTTTRTALGEGGDTTTTTENILEHSREEGVITRIETGTVTVPAGTDPKLIMEMFDRQRTPLAVPVPPAADAH